MAVPREGAGGAASCEGPGTSPESDLQASSEPCTCSCTGKPTFLPLLSDAAALTWHSCAIHRALQLSSRTRCSRQAVLGSVPAGCAGVKFASCIYDSRGWARPLSFPLPHTEAALSRWLRPHPRHSLMHTILGTHWIPSSFSSHTCPAQAFQSRDV